MRLPEPDLKLDRNSVPVLSNAWIDTLCEVYLRRAMPEVFRKPKAPDLDDFVCRCMGLKQDFAYLSHDGHILGMTVFETTNRVVVFDPEAGRAEYMAAEAGTIIIDSRLTERSSKQQHRYRYTLGHEAGHALFHRSYYVSGAERYPLACRADVPAPKGDWRYWTPEERLEHQADRAASALLMPKGAVLRLMELCGFRPGRRYDADRIEAVQQTFDVSKEAATYRLLDMELIGRPDHMIPTGKQVWYMDPLTELTEAYF